jgi:hypothetical protein
MSVKLHREVGLRHSSPACIRQHKVAVDTRGGSRMRESCMYRSGGVRLAAIPAGESPANRGVRSLLYKAAGMMDNYMVYMHNELQVMVGTSQKDYRRPGPSARGCAHLHA